MNKIASTAIIEEHVDLGSGNIICDYVFIKTGTRIGNNNVIGPCSKIGPFVEMKDNNQIDFQACLGGEAQNLSSKGVKSFLKIGSRNTFREFTTANRGNETDGLTMIGDNNYFMSYSHVGHDVKIGNNCVLSNYVGLSGHVEVMDQVVLGGMAGVHQFCKIGSFALISGLAKLTKDVPPFGLAEGRPAKIIGVNAEGLKRNGFTPEGRKKIKNIFRIFYRTGLPFSKSIEKVGQEFPDDIHADLFVDFFRKSERGIMGFGFPRKKQ
jgi:UDP-N-acetylglucosamine acyltransferase